MARCLAVLEIDEGVDTRLGRLSPNVRVPDIQVSSVRTSAGQTPPRNGAGQTPPLGAQDGVMGQSG